jgi:hypothetical protein
MMRFAAELGMTPIALARLAGGPFAVLSLLGMLFITSVRYWIQFVHTAKYKIKPHAIAINTNQIAIFPQLLTCP